MTQARLSIPQTFKNNRPAALIHLIDKLIDILLAIAQIASFDEMLELPRAKAAGRIAQFERPQEVARLLEIRADGEDFVDQVLHAHDAVLAQVRLDQLVVREGDALLVDFAVAALVDQVAHRFERGVPVGDEGFDDFQHFGRGFCEPHEDAVVDLQEAEQLEDLAGFRGDFVDTAVCRGSAGFLGTE